MALIKCPDCGNEVSSFAKQCPRCGYPLANELNDIVKIRIDNDPMVAGAFVEIRENGTKRLLARVRSGSVAEIKTDKDLTIYFTQGMGAMLTTTVSPKNGGRYHASWGPGLFMSRIVSCSKVDVIDS